MVTKKQIVPSSIKIPSNILDEHTEDVLLAQQLKISQCVVDITQKKKMEIMRCVRCPIVRECGFIKNKLGPVIEKGKALAVAIENEEKELDCTEVGKLKASQIADQAYDRYIRDHAYSVIKEERCIFERKEIMTNLQKFVDAGYNIADPRTFIILNELLNNILNSGRISKAFTGMGTFIRKDTADGTIYYPNRALETQVEISKFIIEATEALDRILKSDQQQAASKDFTEHIIMALGLKQGQKVTVKDEYFDKPIIDGVFK